MGSILASDIVTKVQRTLNDLDGVQWGFDELMDWLNEAQRAVVALRPDASAAVRKLDLVAGTIQTLPSDAIRLLSITHNEDGTSCTYAEKSSLDSSSRSWRNATSAKTARHWLYDERTPLTFEVYPPQPAGNEGSLYGSISVTPGECTMQGVNGATEDSVISINDIFEMALHDYCVYRSYSKDATYTVRGGKAQLAWTTFLQRLGQQIQTDRRYGPSVHAPPHAREQRPSEGITP